MDVFNPLNYFTGNMYNKANTAFSGQSRMATLNQWREPKFSALERHILKRSYRWVMPNAKQRIKIFENIAQTVNLVCQKAFHVKNNETLKQGC